MKRLRELLGSAREGFLRDFAIEKDIIVVSEMLLTHSRKKQVLVLGSTATEKAYTLTAVNEEKDGRDDYVNDANCFDYRENDTLPSEIKDKTPLDKKVSSDCKRAEWIPVDYSDKELKLPLTYMYAYLQPSIIPKDHCTFMFSTAGDVDLLSSVFFIDSTLSKLCSLLPEDQTMKLDAIPEEISRKISAKSNLLENELSCLLRIRGARRMSGRFQNPDRGAEHVEAANICLVGAVGDDL